MGKPRRHLCLLKVITCIAYFVPMLALSHTEPINKNEHNNSSTSEEHFLDQIGFKSFIPEIKNSLGSSKASIASKIALKENLEKYRILDESKSLALFIYSQILSGLSSHDVQIRASRLTAHLLRPPIESQFLPIPSYFKETMTHEEYQKETEKYLDGSIRAIKDNELKALTKYTVETIALANHLDRSSETYVQLKKQLYTKFQSYLVLQNKYYELASSRYLGRAMTALLIRYNRNNPSADLEAQLNFLLSRQDDYLSNYITASYTVRDRNHIQKTVPLRSGDFVNKYSFDAESFLISAGVEPGDKANRDRADELNLVNSLLDLKDFPTPAKGRAIAEKIAQNISLTPHEEELYLQTRLSSTGKGFSHVGLIEIKTDPESGISMPWVWDVYPSTPGLAGGRYIGIEAFAPQEKSQKIGFSRYNPTAFYNYYKTQKARDGYKPFIWKTFEFDSVNNGERLNQSNRRYNVATIISKSDVDSLLTYKSEDANTWYYNEIIPRVLTEMKSNITSERAVLFAKSFINMQDTSYCSQAIVLAYLKGVNIDPQPVQDDWKRSVNLISHLMPKIRSRLNLNERIISPSGFMWQAGLSESPATIYLDTMTPRNSIYSDNLSWISE